ncbi:MAG: hypothetical protein FWJ85_06180 [Solitalea sp.]
MMKNSVRLICFLLFSNLFGSGYAQQREPFPIRGVLPWHNFLSGPSAWNLADYQAYLDECEQLGINFIGFHNYTGGGERYASYVEPMIRISYRNILPDAKFDNSLTTRWGYYPLKVKDFAFGTGTLFQLPDGAEAFGSDASILSHTPQEHYAASQDLMRNVIRLAHDRKMEVAMGFEFGVLPPEYFSLNSGQGTFYWRGEANMVPNPAHPLAIRLLYVTIDEILEAYPSIDWITLWLNEHSFMGVDVNSALADASFNGIYQQNASLFSAADADPDQQATTFIGVWSLQYIRLAYDYIKQKAPGVKVMLSGWGGGNQLPMILQGLDRGLPRDIVFSCLNPGLGTQAQPDFLRAIAKNRDVWAIPWLEGDHQLWHYQPRVSLMQEHVGLAAEQGLDGVIAIHWRTEETRWNLEAFARFAQDPGQRVPVGDLYHEFLLRSCGRRAADALASLFLEADTSGWRNQLVSPEYFAYTPAWGRMNEKAEAKTIELIEAIDRILPSVGDKRHRENLEWFRNTFAFEHLLHRVGKHIEPAYQLKNKVLLEKGRVNRRELEEAQRAFGQAPVRELFDVFASKVRSRGELGELSALNQKLWVEYLALKDFLEEVR